MNINTTFTTNFPKKENCGQATPFYNYYIQQPKCDPSCQVNILYDTLPNNWPRIVTNFGPQSLKHIYPNIPDPRDPDCGLYPPQRISRPVNTMYSDIPSASYDPQLVCSWGKKGFQAYPFHSFSPKEERQYTRGILPMPNLQHYTIYHTKTNI